MYTNMLGDIGEIITSSTLRKADCTVIRTLYMPYGDHYTEVDMVAVSRKGIFCIENKNFKGSVEGDTKDSYWNYNGIRIYSPVMQNNVHTAMVRKAVFEYASYVRGVVIFNDKLKSLRVRNRGYSVFRLREFIEYLDSLPLILSAEQVDSVVEVLKPLSDMSIEAKILHIMGLRE